MLNNKDTDRSLKIMVLVGFPATKTSKVMLPLYFNNTEDEHIHAELHTDILLRSTNLADFLERAPGDMLSFYILG